MEESGYYDGSRKVVNLTHYDAPPSFGSEAFALPITAECCKIFTENQTGLPPPFEHCYFCKFPFPSSKNVTAKNPRTKLQTSILNFLKKHICESRSNELTEDIPKSWERHDDLVVFPPDAFSCILCCLSKEHVLDFWSVVSSSLGCKRLAIGGKVSNDEFRSSSVTLVLGSNGWVDHVDNGIHYIFDVTKCMFSSGNITEKLRVAGFDCSGEVVVDLYAGIGYFVFPYLIHAKAEVVHACEWNPCAVEALRRGLKANKIEDRCVVHFGDNKKVKTLIIASELMYTASL